MYMMLLTCWAVSMSDQDTLRRSLNTPGGGGGGSDPVVREILAVQSVLLPRHLVDPQVSVAEVKS